jgi:hypothetical protein
MEQIADLNLNFNYKIETLDLLIKLTLSIVFGILSSYSFRRYGFSINRSTNLISNSTILSVIVTLIITVVKSSLALSLGLVGALSVVRFRNAIKDPLELLNYFSSIAIGLSIGADQYMAGGFFSIVVFLFNYSNFKLKRKNIADQSTILLFRSTNKIDLDRVLSSLKKILKKEFKLISLSNNPELNELCFEVYDLSENELKGLYEIDKEFSVEILPSVI